jgi:hypothetical protein
MIPIGEGYPYLIPRAALKMASMPFLEVRSQEAFNSGRVRSRARVRYLKACLLVHRYVGRLVGHLIVCRVERS